MKNVKLVVLATMTMLFLGMGDVSAQESKIQSVIISVCVKGSKHTIEVVNPDYSVELKEYTTKDNNVHVTLKQEIDKWLEEGYQIMESNSNYLSSGFPVSGYILVKE